MNVCSLSYAGTVVVKRSYVLNNSTFDCAGEIRFETRTLVKLNFKLRGVDFGMA